MTMHDAQNPRELALLVLDEIYERGAYANLALNKALRETGCLRSTVNCVRNLSTEP